jgi:murein DD-endopeptidase MepM/ murein hydrolase activator NlpD
VTVAAEDVRNPASEPARSERFAIAEEYLVRASALLGSIDVDYGDAIGPDDIRRAGEKLNVEIGSPVTPEDIDQLLAAYRNRAIPVLRAVGRDVGSNLDERTFRRIADRWGVEVGDWITPKNVRQLIREANKRPTAPFASAGGVRLHVPSRDVVLIGFHQAAFANVRQMAPRGDLPMTTMPSRGRGTGRRSAADVSVRPGTPVIAPATGRVVEVQHYALYGKYRDARIRIATPNGMLVSVLHVTGPRVRVGDRVQGGETVIARQATKFPFFSQIDAFAGPLPHVHIELRRR